MKVNLGQGPIDVYDIHVKFDAETFSQIEGLARDENRTLSNMVRRIVLLWLKEKR
jgi:hypothetical protein